jgi:hypothetical protein
MSPLNGSVAKMRTPTFVVLIVSFASIALAEDFRTVNGKEYKNATVSRVEPNGIVVRFSGGIVKIPFTELSKEVQERFHYDSQKAAAAYAEQMAAAQQRNQRAEKSGSQLIEAGHQNAHILALFFPRLVGHRRS